MQSNHIAEAVLVELKANGLHIRRSAAQNAFFCAFHDPESIFNQNKRGIKKDFEEMNKFYFYCFYFYKISSNDVRDQPRVQVSEYHHNVLIVLLPTSLIFLVTSFLSSSLRHSSVLSASTTCHSGFSMSFSNIFRTFCCISEVS